MKHTQVDTLGNFVAILDDAIYAFREVFILPLLILRHTPLATKLCESTKDLTS